MADQVVERQECRTNVLNHLSKQLLSLFCVSATAVSCTGENMPKDDTQDR